MSKSNERESTSRTMASVRKGLSVLRRKVSHSQRYYDAPQEPYRSSNSHRERSRNIRWDCVDSQEESYNAEESFSSGDREKSDREHRDEGTRASTSGANQEAGNLSSPSDSGWWNYIKSLIGYLVRKTPAVLGFPYRSISVAVMTQSHESSVDELMKRLRAAQGEQSLPLGDVKFLQLPEHGLDTFTFPSQTIDVMILCCSINFRRFSVTDVQDALYGVFLANARRTFGREKIAVIAHDFPPVTSEVRRLQMTNFKTRQPSTFEAASLVMMCGNLGTQLEMDVADWLQLEEFIINASKKFPFL
ncbi:uncharacterized protein [Diadema setosum]|uniref:uncharacterized protein n=1 Tax=Diadema setosum TaxID=31175 RepID=UPI003B3BEA00